MLEKSAKVVSLNPSGITILPERMRRLRSEVVNELVESIKRQGLLQPIVVRPRPRGGMGYILIAGWHRLMAIRKLKGESIKASVLDGFDADHAMLAEIDENLVRAELTEAEEAQHLDRRKTLYEQLYPETKHGGAPGKSGGGKKAKGGKRRSFVKDTAKKTGRHKSTVSKKAKRGKQGRGWLSKIVGTCLDKGTEIDALNKLSPNERKNLIAQARRGEKVSAKLRLKQLKREQREKELSTKQVALPTKQYGVIVADPEWRFEPWSRKTGLDRAADNHYPTSVLEVIKARDVASISAKDCVLFLWATTPMLPHALLVMAAWDFDYKSNYIWRKNKAGTGYWNRERHELLLIGTKGDIPAPAPGKQWESIISAARGKHSEKPVRAMKMIEEYFPNLPKIELNCRGKARPGWTAWGNEAEEKRK